MIVFHDNIDGISLEKGLHQPTINKFIFTKRSKFYLLLIN